MDKQQHDLLVECFNQLFESLTPDDSSEIFVQRVAEDYMMRLVRAGHIPLRYLETLRDDICTEVQDILRIRTYGYMSLQEFLSKTRPSGRRSAC